MEINEPYNSDDDKPKKKQTQKQGLEYIDSKMYSYQTAKSPADLRKAMQAEQQ